MERLQKYLAKCGVCSRRKAEELIASGRVQVNETTIIEMGFKVSGNERILVDGIPIETMPLKYLVMNKPRYFISSVDDDKNRKTVISLLPLKYQSFRIFPVGRLDYDTKGVLLLTNDGDFMNTLVGPQSLLEKEYLVRVDGIVSKEQLKQLSMGVNIDGYTTRKCFAYSETYDRKNNSSLLGIILQEGRYHQVKRMIESIGLSVKRLTRIRFGDIKIDGLKEGEVRELTPHEVKQLLISAKTEKDYAIKRVRQW